MIRLTGARARDVLERVGHNGQVHVIRVENVFTTRYPDRPDVPVRCADYRDYGGRDTYRMRADDSADREHWTRV